MIWALTAIPCFIFLYIFGKLWWFSFRPGGWNKRLYGDEYRAKFTCSHCDVPVSQHVRYYSGGVCPHCGHKSVGTVLDFRKTAMRWQDIDGVWQWKSKADDV